MKWMVLAVVAALPVCAQQLDLSALDGLAAKAKESATVNVDGDKLRFAAGFLSKSEGDEKTKNLLSSMKGIYVRSFEFGQPNQYSLADLEPVRKQLQAPGWSKVVDVKDGKESAEIYFFSKDGQTSGMAILAAEPEELAVVNIVGPVDLNTLAGLGGALGVPNMRTEFKPKVKIKEKAKD